MNLTGFVGSFDDLDDPAMPGLLASLPGHWESNTVTTQAVNFRLAWSEGTYFEDDNCACWVGGNPCWSDSEISDTAQRSNNARALAVAYRRMGTDFLQRLCGRFAVVLFDRNLQSLQVFVDRFGKLPVYWSEAPGGLAFGASADLVRLSARREAGLDHQGLFNYLFFHMVPSPGTVYEGIRKLPAAHGLHHDQGETGVRPYWMPRFRETPALSVKEGQEEFEHLLRMVMRRLDTGEGTGSFLSGGLDSSTVSGILASVRQGSVDTYSIGFDAPGYDEIAYARIASQRFQTRAHEYYVQPADIVEALPLIAAAYDEPFGNSSALPAYFCARMAAQDGRERLLAGDGGDELFGGNERYVTQQVFEHYGRLPRWMRGTLLEPALARLGERSGLLGKVQSYVRQANIPLPARLQRYNFMLRLGTEQVLEPEFLATINPDLPLDLERDHYARPHNASTLNRMLYLDWQHTLTDNDLRKVSRVCQLAGITVEYPLLDEAIVEFSTQIPSTQKISRNRLRHYFKQVTRSLLPTEILNKPKHGFGLPFGVWLQEDRQLGELAAAHLERMGRRRIIRQAFVNDLVERHRREHAGYYGEFIWVLIMLDLWLTAHGIEP